MKEQNQSVKVRLRVLPESLTICQLSTLDGFSFKDGFYFLGKTEDEISLVCPTANLPNDLIAKREDGWRAFKIEGILDFSLVGILAGLSSVLADFEISIFAVSTFNTDYVLVKETVFEKAEAVLLENGYAVTDSVRRQDKSPREGKETE